MNRVKCQDRTTRELAWRVLTWVALSKRHLTTAELQHAVAITDDLDQDSLQDSLPNIEDMVSVCAGLITADQDMDEVRWIHKTVQDFFERTSWDWFPNGSHMVAQAFLTYLHTVEKDAKFDSWNSPFTTLKSTPRFSLSFFGTEQLPP